MSISSTMHVWPHVEIFWMHSNSIGQEESLYKRINMHLCSHVVSNSLNTSRNANFFFRRKAVGKNAIHIPHSTHFFCAERSVFETSRDATKRVTNITTSAHYITCSNCVLWFTAPFAFLLFIPSFSLYAFIPSPSYLCFKFVATYFRAPSFQIWRSFLFCILQCLSP